MFSDRALKELEVRRQQLIALSCGHRLGLQRHLAEFGEAIGWVDRAAGWLRMARPLMWVVVPAAGYLLARPARVALGWIPSILPWWRVLRSIGGRLWRARDGAG